MKTTISTALLCTCVVSLYASEADVQRLSADLGSLRHFGNWELSLEGIEQSRHVVTQRLDELTQAPFEKLNRADQVDHILMRNKLEATRRELERYRGQLEADLPYLPFLDTILTLDGDRKRAQALDDAQAARDVAALVDMIKGARKLAEKKKPAEEAGDGEEEGEAKDKKKEEGYVLSAPHALRIARRVKGCQQRLDGWYKHYAAYRPQFEWWNKKPREAANKALGEYEMMLREKIAGAKGDDGPLIGEAVGKERLEKLLAGEFIPYSPEELIAIGEKEFAWCVAEAEKAARELGFDDRLAALEKVKTAHVNPGEQDRLVADFACDATAFVEERDLVTVPDLCRKLWNVHMIEPKAQQRIPYALFGGNRLMVAYAAGGMEHDKKEMAMRGNNRHTTRIVIAHEVIPGHHLQRFMGARYRPDRGLFSTPFFVEGWALYWEVRLWDLGFQRSPEDRIGMLFWRMHRCARIIVSLKFHLGEMTPDEMVDFLVKQVGHEKNQARSEVRRYIAPGFGALYQAAYMLGGLQLKRLHEQLVPSRMTEKEFHDRILRFGPIPVDMIRVSLDEKIPLAADYRSDWRFYGEGE